MSERLSPPKRKKSLRQLEEELIEDEGGAVYFEYITLVFVIGLIVSAALIAVGVPLVEGFRNMQVFSASPIP